MSKIAEAIQSKKSELLSALDEYLSAMQKADESRANFKRIRANSMNKQDEVQELLTALFTAQTDLDTTKKLGSKLDELSRELIALQKQEIQ